MSGDTNKGELPVIYYEWRHKWGKITTSWFGDQTILEGKQKQRRITATYHKHEDVVTFLHSQKRYPKIGDANFKCAFWTFKQQLALKIWAQCTLSTFSLYCDFRNIIHHFNGFEHSGNALNKPCKSPVMLLMFQLLSGSGEVKVWPLVLQNWGINLFYIFDIC